VLTHVGIRSWEGPSLHASTTNRGGCPVEGGWHKRVRRLASVWLGSNMQSSLEAHPRVKSELGCHSHRVSRRPRQSSRALVHCHQTPCCCQLCTLWHRTHTSRTAVTCTTASGLVCALPKPPSSFTERTSQQLQRVRRETFHTRRCWCRRARACAREAVASGGADARWG
jgi:hypothetical protein